MMFIGVFCGIMNVVSFLLYAYDKKCACKGKWRIPEFTLLSFAFWGGALGAYLAMYIFHHKTQHVKFQICVPLFLFIQIIIMLIIKL